MAGKRLPHNLPCMVTDCESRSCVKGLCKRHYQRWHRYGDSSICHPLGSGKLMRGNSTRPEYTVWEQMISRCENRKNKDYQRYGGRGIQVCARWRKSFTAFFGDMGTKPSAQHSIERQNNDGDYEPNNCCWATRREQVRNTRRNLFLEHHGRVACLVEWAETTGLSRHAIRSRLRRGWSVADALTLSLRTKQDQRRRTERHEGETASVAKGESQG
jgi:hypothetical protein